MPTLRWAFAVGAALVVALGSAASLDAQWQTWAVGLRTNGSVMRPGDCLRVELLALEQVTGQFTTRVTYRFEEMLASKDKDGHESQSRRSASRERAPGPTLDTFDRFQASLLDDTFCFGQSSLPGPYDISVDMRMPSTGPSVGALRSCVVFDPGDAPSPAGPGCSFLLRGVKRAESGGTFVFDGEFPEGAFYKAALIRGHRVEALIEGGIYRTSPHELVISSPDLQGAAGGDMDLLLFDQASGRSTTLARLTLPRTN